MSTKSPLSQVKDAFGGKDKLVDKLVGLVESADESKDELRKRLLGAANGKLIRLHAIATQVKQKGGHDKLVTATAESLGRGKDKDYVEKLSSFGDARLLDMLQVAERRKQRTAAAAGDKTTAAAKGAGKEKKAPARRKATAEKTA